MEYVPQYVIFRLSLINIVSLETIVYRSICQDGVYLRIYLQNIEDVSVIWTIAPKYNTLLQLYILYIERHTKGQYIIPINYFCIMIGVWFMVIVIITCYH